MKLLIVEDEEKINMALYQGFSEEGFQTDTALHGKEALSLLEKKSYDCVILDLMLPEIDGITILETVRAERNYTPVIILTAKDQIEDKVKGLEKGADDYIAKPFSFSELLARVKAVIRRMGANESILAVGTLEVNPYTHIVTRAQSVVPLTGKDFSLLEYLVKHKNAIVSEQQIIDHVWDFDTTVTSNVVASHMKNLRMKIDKAFPKEKPIIHTIRGLGYRVHE